LVVMPEGGRSGWYSNWRGRDSVGYARWERFHLTELMRLLQQDWGGSSRQAIAGFSMGGLGALKYAGRHPGMFSSAASFSGVVSPTAPGGPQNVMSITARYGNNPRNLWGDPRAHAAPWRANDPISMTRTLSRMPVFLSCGDGRPGVYDAPRRPYNAVEGLLHRQNVRLSSALRRSGARQLHTRFYGRGSHSWPYWQRELDRALPMLVSSIQSR